MFKKIIHKIFHHLKKTYFEYQYDAYKNKYEISNDFIFNGDGIMFSGDGRIVIKSNSYIGGNSRLSSNKNYKIYIGKNCSISHNVRIYTSTYVSNTDFNKIKYKRPLKNGSVEIADGVWIGLNVVILPGVKIGKNSIVGANSVVAKDIPENSIVSGIPAMVFRKKC